jgi:hypothetical protein
MRTTLRFTSVVGGVAALIVLAAVILSANDWLSSSSGHNQRIGARTSAPAPQFGTPAAQPTLAPQPTAPPPQPLAAPQPAAAVVQPAAAPAPAVPVVHVAVAAPAVSVGHGDEDQALRPAQRRGGDGGHGHDRGDGGHTGGRGGGGQDR